MLNIQIQPGDFQGDIVPQQGSQHISPGGQPSIALLPGHSWYSPGGTFRLTVQETDGNLVWQVVDDATLPPWEKGQALNPADLNWHPIWSPGIQEKGVTEVDMQLDGNLVAYAGPSAVFNTRTYGNEHSYLRLQDDGNLVVYSPTGCVFATNTSWIKVLVQGLNGGIL